MNNSTPQSDSKIAKVLRFGSKAILALVVVLFVAHIAWTNSGSNEWKVVSDRDGIRVSTLKTPGYSLLKYKMEMHVDSRLSDVVFYMSDINTGRDVGGVEIQRLQEVVAEPTIYAYDNYKVDLSPFGLVDVMIVNHYVQDPETKKVTINVYAAPQKKPVEPNIMRVLHLSNMFTLTAVKTGGTDIEFMSEMDLGLPYVLQNLVFGGVVEEEGRKMREMLKKDKYKNKQPAFIVEPYEDQKVTNAQT